MEQQQDNSERAGCKLLQNVDVKCAKQRINVLCVSRGQ
jgi:hypothetical protein